MFWSLLRLIVLIHEQRIQMILLPRCIVDCADISKSLPFNINTLIMIVSASTYSRDRTTISLFRLQCFYSFFYSYHTIMFVYTYILHWNHNLSRVFRTLKPRFLNRLQVIHEPFNTAIYFCYQKTCTFLCSNLIQRQLLLAWHPGPIVYVLQLPHFLNQPREG